MKIPLWVVGGLLLAAVLVAHSGALWGGFHYDDYPSIVENPAIRSWQPLFYWTARPLTLATLAANFAFGRLDPFGYLVVNLALHLATVGMVFLVGRRLLGDERWALVAALVFALHPVNAEAVNYIVARSSLLATLGTLAAFWAFLRWRDGGGGAWPVLGAAAFAAALASKESAAALIIPIWAYPWLGDRQGESSEGRRPRRPRLLSSVVPTLPWSAVLAVYLVVWWTLRSTGSTEEVSVATAAYPVWSFVELVGRSLGLWVWPWPLGIEHQLTFANHFDAPLAAALVAAGIGVVVAGAVLWRRAPLAVWTLIWVFAGFAPLLPLPWLTTKGLFQENRLAFSAVGLAWLTAMAARAIVARLGGGARARFARGAAVLIGALLVVGAVRMDRVRSAVWNDDRRLWEEAVDHYPENRGAHLNLGMVHMNRTQFDLAEDEFRRALAVSPGYPRAYYALGQLALRRERYDEAREWLLRVIAVAPDYPATYYVLGEVERKQGRAEAAETAFLRAVELNPRDAKAHERLGLLAQQAGNDAAAETSYLAALRHNPDSALARNNLGTIYIKKRDWLSALEHFTVAARRNPNDVDAAFNRAMTLDVMGKKDEARAVANALLRHLPPDPQFDGYRRGAQALTDGGGP